MSVLVKCDRCGAQEQTSGVMLFAGHCGPGIPTARPELPDGWTRPRLPAPDGSAWDRERCPDCKAGLFRFMAGETVKVITCPPDFGSATQPGKTCRD